MKKIVLLSSDAIKSDQDGIRKNLLSLDVQIHSNAVQCLLHAKTHGDTSLMTRLLVDIIDDKSGYRRQGLISWMRKHSPMELKGKTINLTGMIESDAQVKLMQIAFPDVDSKLFVVGERRPFLVDEAAAAPFTTDNANQEVVKPIFQSVLLSPIEAARKKFEASVENTLNGQPIDPSKPYYDGKHQDKVVNFFAAVAKLQAELPEDATRELRQAQARIKDDSALVSSLGGNVKTEELSPVEAKKTA